tara:strand:- start:56 stop:346 length:291 start_codon:yes stop_codon:yes gene_type:complete
MSDNLGTYFWPTFWFFLVSFAALYEIDLHYKNRELLKEYQSLIKEKDQQEVRWKELMLNLSEISSGVNLEKEAEKKALMKLPDSSKIKVVVTDEEN